MPADVYRFAKDQQVTSNSGQLVKLSRPYDCLRPPIILMVWVRSSIFLTAHLT
ncbi:MAG: hypothetical protein AAF749_12955 [Pseudomonadota bacterium]